MKRDSFCWGRRRFAAVLSVLAATAAWPAAGGARDTAAAASPRTLLVLGDSLSAEYGLPRGTGWVALLGQRLAEQAPGWTVVNASISGETTAGGAARIGGLLERHRPGAVIVELGGNDALRGLDLAASASNLEGIVATAREAGAQVLILGMQVPPNYGRVYTDAFARLFVDVARRQHAALVPFLLERIAGDTEAYFQPDRIHPNQQAQAALLETVWPAVEQLLARASAS